MSISTPYTKKQIFLAGVVCSLIVLQLASLVLSLVQDSNWSATDAVWLAGSLVNILILLKFLLPNWEPHQELLAWLLGTSLVLPIIKTITTLIQHLQQAVDTISILTPIAIAIAYFLLILLAPDFHLLRGLLCKKSTEKTAGVFSAILLGLLPISFVFAQITANLYNNEATIVWSTIPWQGMLIQTGYTIIIFSWPVLSRPILEKEKPIMKITFEQNPNPKQKPDQSALGFGKYFTDHMFLMNYDEGGGAPGESADSLGCKGWHDPRIVPYGPIELEPSAMCLHYGQEVFEGMKAYCGADGQIRLFRPEENMARLNLSNERLCIPLIDESFAVHAIEELVKIERDWIPTQDGTSLYIRPFIFAVDPFLGVRPASQYIFAVILSPVGAYYAGGLSPVSIYIEQECVRAVRGGTGFAKAGGNYAGSLKAQKQANAQGYAQVLWLDGIERKYIEEVGAMNVFFVFDDEIVTPALQGSILGGITRKSCIEILRGWGFRVTERALSIDEVQEAYRAGALKEAFGSGTAAVISPIGALSSGGELLTINNGAIGALSQRLYDELTGIQWGKVEDARGWTKMIA